jgi:hypothetical protein
MRFTTILASLSVLLLITLAPAQTKISGSAQCGKPDTQQKVDVPDHPDHSLSISQAKCAWTKPMEVAGIQDKDGVTTAMDDNHGASSTGHGYYVDNMANGDKIYVRYQGTASMKEGAAQGKWTYAGGTGKFKGIKGGGTYKGKVAVDGSATYDVEGEYTLPK